MVHRIQGQILLESLVISVLLFTGASASVLVSLQEQAQCQQDLALENALVVALNGNAVRTEVSCTDVVRPTEMRCLTDVKTQPISGVIHRLDNNGLTIAWPKLGASICGHDDCTEDFDRQNIPLWDYDDSN